MISRQQNSELMSRTSCSVQQSVDGDWIELHPLSGPIQWCHRWDDHYPSWWESGRVSPVNKHLYFGPVWPCATRHHWWCCWKAKLIGARWHCTALINGGTWFQVEKNEETPALITRIQCGQDLIKTRANYSSMTFWVFKVNQFITRFKCSWNTPEKMLWCQLMRCLCLNKFAPS